MQMSKQEVLQRNILTDPNDSNNILLHIYICEIFFILTADRHWLLANSFTVNDMLLMHCLTFITTEFCNKPCFL
jgi:hypothetical protein